MYIEQGYRGEIGLWKFFVIPLAFMGFMVFNYVITVNSPVSVEDTMQQLIAQMGSNIVLIFLLLPLAAGLLVVLGWTYLVHRQSITSLTTSRKKVDWKRVFFSFGLWSVLTLILTGIDIYASPDKYVLNFDLAKFIPLAIIAIVLIPMQTSFEEYLFRGHMMQGIGILAKNRWVPLVVTSTLFGLMHIANPEVEKLGHGVLVYYIGTGFFLGILTLMDEGLELALGFHAANNLITALLVTADWTAFQTNSVYKDISEPALGWDVLIPVFVIFPLLLWFFSKKYGWKNWKQRLFGKVMTKEEFATLTHEESSLA
ncbi:MULTISPECIES: CPBP family intramembrane glutamic endopeptidase [Flavobacteriaceae]|uniref:CPBP family intramembrane metalloprotease n=1 Tax=Flagellimonas alvinocaridis TaxID=2530200 RepID=A0A4S8RR83_9FLAO|nr:MULTISPECIES: CPBP family intramembrane glutamic endopeptidase [Allomuricauda]MDC6363525.1 CPBP family intramembrane metalloprotease [Muricauda sp. SP22]THV57599.1 CPBP family intramembrane metalloprotease [Allomuricauda alvinocaridis]